MPNEHELDNIGLLLFLPDAMRLNLWDRISNCLADLDADVGRIASGRP